MHFEISTIDGLTDVEKGRWNELLTTVSPVRSAFLSPAFAKAVQDVRGGVFVIHVRGGSDEEGFLAFQIRSGRKWLGHAEKVAGGMSDFFGIVGNLNERVDAARLLSAAGLSSLRFDHGVKELLPFDFQDIEQSRGARVQVSDFDHFKAGLVTSNRKFAQSVLSRERRLERELGGIVFRWQAEDPIAALEQLVTVKRDQYLRTGVADSFASPWHRELLTRLLKAPSRECSALVSTLEAGGHWIGSKFSLVCADTLHSWFSVYDPHHGRHGPGHLVWFRTLEEGCRRGICVFDFGEGESNYKAQYGGESYTVLKGAIRRNTFRGRSERLLQSIEWRLAALKRPGRKVLAGPEAAPSDG